MTQEHLRDHYAVWISEEILGVGSPPVYEVPLQELTDEVAKVLGYPDWCIDVCKAPETAWMERIHLDDEAPDARQQFLAEFSKYAPVALAACDGNAWWVAGYHDDPGGADQFLLGPRGDVTRIGDTLRAAGFRQWHEIARFVAYLNGFREDYPPSGGLTKSPDDAPWILTEEYVQGSFGEFSLGNAWDPCLAFFTSRGGDALLINHVGACAWWPAGSKSLHEPFADDLNSCVEQWIAFRWTARCRARPDNACLYPFGPFGLPPT